MAAAPPTDAVERLVGETLHASRLLGRDPFLVLHGGGNTSAKTADHLWAKASGFDLGQLGREGLVQLRNDVLARMLATWGLSDGEMMAGYEKATVGTGAPAPTIESLLHHALPLASVLHTHADAIVALTDTVHGPSLPAEALGDGVIVLPYVMPGFDLATTVAAARRDRGDGARAVVLAHHGLFTMGDDPREAYERHVELVARAEDFVASETGLALAAPLPVTGGDVAPAGLDGLREDLEAHATVPPHVAAWQDGEVREFISRPDLHEVSQRGPTTLEHVIRTKRVPMIDGDVAGYVRRYAHYVERHRQRSPAVRMLDPVPRVVLDGTLGLVTTGPDARAVGAVRDIYRHTIRIITAAERLGGYRTMSEAQAFDIEYWELEQRRLR
ncbi:class II aldolase/adducin family protein [Georgenia sp. AZ-5]|uniref:class II aldolase/adducin family protein n=1 Tax=Georgenia sp. AZ-5 TaxID=3367526 RepID=UPI003754AD53